MPSLSNFALCRCAHDHSTTSGVLLYGATRRELNLGMSVGRATPACVPTWRGYIETTKDALIIFEAALGGQLAHCIRRPHDRERNSLIVSGNVFVYEEGTSGIKRWTDGIPWSPSRILTNFLLYRQLSSPFPPGEKKRAMKRSQRPLRPGEPYALPGPRPDSADDSLSMTAKSPTTPGLKTEESADKDSDRTLIGSLVDSYEFKPGGLLKKTMTVTVNTVQHHLVSYYSYEDAKNHLQTPREDPNIKDLRIRDDLMSQPKFKIQNFDDAGDGTYDEHIGQQPSFPLGPPGFSMRLGPFSTPASALQTPAQAHFPHHDQASPMYYGGYPFSNVQNPSLAASAAYSSMPNTPSFPPMPSGTNPYPLYPQHTQHQPQTPTHYYPQSQPSVKIEGQQHHQSLQTQNPYESTQSSNALTHVGQEQLQPAPFQQSYSDLMQRRSGNMDMYNTPNSGLGINTYYGSSANVSSPVQDNVLPQPAHFPSQYGENADDNQYTGRHPL